MSDDVRFRQVTRYAAWHGYAAGFPNFHQAWDGSGVVYGTLLLRGDVVETRAVPRDTYGVYHIEDVPAMMRAANDYALSQGYAAGFPTFEQGAESGTVCYGTVLFRAGTAEMHDVPRDELGVYHIEDVPAMMRAANDWATAHQYAAGFPNFHQANHGAGVVCGIVAIPAGAVTWRDTAMAFLQRYVTPVPWKVLLCHVADGTPGIGLEGVARQFFTREGAGKGFMYDYWSQVTFGTTDIGDTTIHPGIKLAQDSTELALFSGTAQRAKVAQWGVDAARTMGIPIDDDLDHVIILLSLPCDSGKAPRKRLVFGGSFGVGMSEDENFYAHEMGHAFGIGHGFSESTSPCSAGAAPGEYCDVYDIMSWRASVRVFQVELNPTTRHYRGPGVSGLNLQRLGAMDHTRIWRAPAGPFDTEVTLAAINRPDVDAPLMLTFMAPSRQAAASGATSLYAVDYREPTGWDRGLTGPVVVVRELAAGRKTVLLTDYHGGVLQEGDPFVTPDGGLSLRLVRIDRTSATATVRIRSLGGSGPLTIRIEDIILNPPGGNPLTERIIMTNGGSAEVDLTGWTITDAAPTMPHVYTFPAVTLASGGAVVVWTGTGNDRFPDLYWGRMAAVWNNRGDTATLRDASGQVISTLTVR